MWFAKLKRRCSRYLPQIKLALKFCLPVLLLLVVIKFIWPYLELARQTLSGPVNIVSVIFPKETTLNSFGGRTNVLLLGIGGKNHEGPELTDSIIVASVKTDMKKGDISPVVLISIPRDIYLDSISSKVNSAYFMGNEKKPGSGFILAKSVVSQITGLPIHYAFVVDFTGFEKTIDLLGGVDIKIERVLDDQQYPIAGKENETCGLEDGLEEEIYVCRFEHLHFEPGLTHLDGEMGLKFVRSRHATDDEGTDFARARRQQLLLQAVKTKVFSSETLLNPAALTKLYNTFKDHINTDISSDEMAVFLKLALNNDKLQAKSVVLDDQFFDNPPIDYRGWVLVPKDGDFSQIQEFIKKSLEQ